MKRGRFAPSPTGPLHFGSLLSALASYCDARSRGGEWLVRIEDVDAPRSRPGAANAILATLERYGFRWDGSVVQQSERTPHYAAALDSLRAAGRMYLCGCTRQQLARAPMGTGGERVYPGTCRAGVKGVGRAWRVRVDDESVGFRDRLQGWQEQGLARDVGDFVLRRADGLHAYQLAVVVDDALQGVSDVVRGADLLASTPRQLWLQRVLGYPAPEYLHIPVAIDARGRKLSKESAAAALPMTPLPALVAAWRFLGQRETPSTPATIGEFWSFALNAWDPARLPPVAMLLAPEPVEGAG